MTKRLVFFIWIIILSPFLSLFFLVQLASFGFFGPLPSLQQLENPKSNLATEIISEDGVVLGKYFFENRTKVEFEEISNNLINALIATEDIRFKNHSGIDVRALFRRSVSVDVGLPLLEFCNHLQHVKQTGAKVLT